MDQYEASRIIDRSMSFQHTSLRYSEPDEIVDCSILCNDADVIVLTVPFDEYIKIHWAANDAQKVLKVIRPLHGSLYIEFIPPEFVDAFGKHGFGIHSEFLDFFNTDLEKTLSEPADINKIKFLDRAGCGRASELTMESRNDSRGFRGDSKEWFEEWIGTDNCSVIIIEENGLLIGLCCISLYDFDNVKGPSLWIREIAVKPSFRGKGYGKQLLQQAISYGISKGAKRGFLHCDIENKNAIGLYNKFGFFSKPERGQINMAKNVQKYQKPCFSIITI